MGSRNDNPAMDSSNALSSQSEIKIKSGSRSLRKTKPDVSMKGSTVSFGNRQTFEEIKSYNEKTEL